MSQLSRNPNEKETTILGYVIFLSTIMYLTDPKYFQSQN